MLSFSKILRQGMKCVQNSNLSTLVCPTINEFTNSECTTFKIGHVVEADFPAALELMNKEFLPRDPLCKVLEIEPDAHLDLIFEEVLREGLSLKVTHPDSNEMVGISLNGKSCPGDTQKMHEFKNQCPNCNIRNLIDIWNIMLDGRSKVHHLTDDKCLFDIAFLAVSSNVKASGLATKLVHSSICLGKDAGFGGAVIDCTSLYSAKIAEKLTMRQINRMHFCETGMAKLPEKPHTHMQSYFLELNSKCNPPKSEK